MQVNDLTIEQFLAALQNETDIDKVKAVTATFAADLKTTKETLIKICQLFGLYENGEFAQKIKVKNVLTAITSAGMEAMNPMTSATKLQEKYGFLAEIATIATKYKSF